MGRVRDAIKDLAAEHAAEEKLAEIHAAEFTELLRLEMLRNGLEMVTMRRVITKTVSESEAMILSRNGWERT